MTMKTIRLRKYKDQWVAEFRDGWVNCYFWGMPTARAAWDAAALSIGAQYRSLGAHLEAKKFGVKP